MVYRDASNLEGLVIKTPTWATPTILFERGSEVFGHQGYLSPKEFYQALGLFKLEILRHTEWHLMTGQMQDIARNTKSLRIRPMEFSLIN